MGFFHKFRKKDDLTKANESGDQSQLRDVLNGDERLKLEAKHLELILGNATGYMGMLPEITKFADRISVSPEDAERLCNMNTASSPKSNLGIYFENAKSVIMKSVTSVDDEFGIELSATPRTPPPNPMAAPVTSSTGNSGPLQPEHGSEENVKSTTPRPGPSSSSSDT